MVFRFPGEIVGVTERALRRLLRLKAAGERLVGVRRRAGQIGHRLTLAVGGVGEADGGCAAGIACAGAGREVAVGDLRREAVEQVVVVGGDAAVKVGARL